MHIEHISDSFGGRLVKLGSLAEQEDLRLRNQFSFQVEQLLQFSVWQLINLIALPFAHL